MAKTSLSAGIALYDILSADETVAAFSRKVFPLYVDKAELPYVAYRQKSLDQNPVKRGFTGADTVVYEVGCFAATYNQCIGLSEAVREALDGKTYSGSGIVMRSCLLTNAAESWLDDAFCKTLEFTIKI